MKDYQNKDVQMQVLIDYLQVMIARRDWHGVSDAANDLREMEAEMRRKAPSGQARAAAEVRLSRPIQHGSAAMSNEAMKQALEALELLAKYEHPHARWQIRKPLSGGPIVTIYPHKLASDAAGILRTAIEQAKKQEPVTILPDGSAFGVMSFPLPDDHWLYAPNQYRDGEYEPIDLPKPILTHALRDAVVAAVRYAVRGATMRGQETDFDPDALVQNAVYALCGPYTTPQPQEKNT